MQGRSATVACRDPHGWNGKDRANDACRTPTQTVVRWRPPQCHHRCHGRSTGDSRICCRPLDHRRARKHRRCPRGVDQCRCCEMERSCRLLHGAGGQATSDRSMVRSAFRSVRLDGVGRSEPSQNGRCGPLEWSGGAWKQPVVPRPGCGCGPLEWSGGAWKQPVVPRPGCGCGSLEWSGGVSEWGVVPRPGCGCGPLEWSGGVSEWGVVPRSGGGCGPLEWSGGRAQSPMTTTGHRLATRIRAGELSGPTVVQRAGPLGPTKTPSHQRP